MRKLDIRPAFAADVKRTRKARTPIDWETLNYVLTEVIAGRDVPSSLKPHSLRREWAGWSEFHLEDDLLVVYRLTDEWATFLRMGTHDDLFREWIPHRQR